ncbi:hypothetical protein CL634_01020 [bacterium]|nr:hypothetical protein [bacterium]|tara:strand:- start:796 stop:1131 length:336 start_codon:yes stop_codon:yes gene_type:complete
MGEPTNFHLFNEGIKVVSNCPVCSARYQNNRALVIQEKQDAHLVYLKCRRCQTAVLAVILTNSLGVSSVGLVTDLGCDEVLRYKDAKPLSTDDVIDVHQLLTKEDLLALVS